MDTLLSVEEAARKLGGLSKYTIHAWLSSGKMLGFPSGHSRTRATDLNRRQTQTEKGNVVEAATFVAAVLYTRIRTLCRKFCGENLEVCAICDPQSAVKESDEASRISTAAQR